MCPSIGLKRCFGIRQSLRIKRLRDKMGCHFTVGRVYRDRRVEVQAISIEIAALRHPPVARKAIGIQRMNEQNRLILRKGRARI
jgi:hypothetical protein